MGRNNRHKSAISITLDSDILDFFSGKGRSGRINHILKLYLRSRLSDENGIQFEDKTNRQIFAPAISVVQNQFGSDSLQAAIMLVLFGVIE